jgi:hypothetical protein
MMSFFFFGLARLLHMSRRTSRSSPKKKSQKLKKKYGTTTLIIVAGLDRYKVKINFKILPQKLDRVFKVFPELSYPFFPLSFTPYFFSVYFIRLSILTNGSIFGPCISRCQSSCIPTLCISSY